MKSKSSYENALASMNRRDNIDSNDNNASFQAEVEAKSATNNHNKTGSITTTSLPPALTNTLEHIIKQVHKTYHDYIP